MSAYALFALNAVLCAFATAAYVEGRKPMWAFIAVVWAFLTLNAMLRAVLGAIHIKAGVA